MIMGKSVSAEAGALWDQQPQVCSPVGRPLSDLLAEGPSRQSLPGFEPVYRDFVDYIIRCTHRIWEQKNVGLCRTHYSDDAQLHTLSGPVIGAEAVVQGTIGALGVFSDRVVIGEDVIWSEDAPGLFYSSHRIVSRSTHLGDDPLYGPATGRLNGAMTIADCLVRENRIVEEWLVRDNLRAVWQLGGDAWSIARSLAEADRLGDSQRHDWRKAAIAAARLKDDSIQIPAGHPAEVPASMLALALDDDLYGDAAVALAPAAEIRWPSNRHGFGRGYWIGCLTQLRGALHEPAWKLQHVAARPLPHGETAVALRWSLAGVHGGAGVWGQPTGREILIMAVSHYRMRGQVILEDISVFDELAVLRQVAGGLGA